MAANTLRFVVEVAADQATQALTALSTAVNQSGIQMRSTLLGIGPAAKQAGNEIVTLGDRMRSFAQQQRSEARAASFYVRELAAIVPMSDSVRTAITGLTSAFVGGLGLGTAIGLVVTGISLLVGKLREAEEAQKKAAAAAAEHAKTLGDLHASARRYQLQAEGFRPEQIEAMEVIGPLDARIATLTQRYGALGTQVEELVEVERMWRAEQAQNPYGPGQSRAAWAKSEIERLKAERESVTAEINRLRAERDAHAAVFRGRVAVAEAGAPAPGFELRAATAAPGERIENPRTPVTLLKDDTLRRTKDLVDFQELHNQLVRESIELQKQWGQTIGAVFAQYATGKITARQAIASLLGSAIKQIAANAAVTATEGAKSQAGIPIFGPALAITAMAELFAAVIAMQGSVPSARGGWWDTGTYEGLAMIHQREMVLPEREAEAVRSGARGTTVNINAVDAQGVRELLQEELPRVLRTIQRRGGS